MADNNNLPSTINGDGRKFISLLKGYLNDIKASLEDQINEATKIWNGIADNPDTISEQVRNITIDERSVNGSVSLILKWDSTPIKQYAGVSIDIKVGDFHDTAEQFAGKKILQHYDTGKTNIFTIPNVEIGKKYEFTIRGRDIRNALSENARAPITYYYVSEQTHVPEAPYEATIIFDKRGAYWSWKQKPQNGYQWTELRLDEHVGEVHNRLDLTTDWHSTAKPYARVGTGYIYNKGVGNSYSVPATVNYSKSVPAKPTQFVVKPVVEGLNITFASIPEDCTGAIVYVNDEENFVVNNSLNYLCSTGTYTVKVCYIDIFGNGEMSDPITISTVEEIPIEMLNKEKLGIKAVEDGITDINKARVEIGKQIDSLKNADNDANAKINSLNSYRTEVDKKIGNINTALTTMDGVIDVKVKDAKDTAEARLTVTKNAINSVIDDKISGVNSSITQLSNAVDVKVKDAKDTAESRLTATAKAINSTVSDNFNKLQTSITQLSNAVDVKVKDAKDTAESRLTATAKVINSTVSDNFNKLQTSITQVADSIDVKVQDAKDTAEARLTVTENAINSVIDDKISSVNSSITQLSNAVDVKVKDAKDTAESRLTATAKAINSTVSDNFNKLQTSITQVADSIEVKVQAGVDKLTGKEIVSRINLTPDTVSISGKYIHITGETVFDDGVIIAKHIGDKAVVGTKIADGAITTDKLVANAITGNKIAANAITSDKIKTGEITADNIATGTITGDKLSASTITGDKIVAGTISGDKIAANSISGDKIQAGSIDADKIQAGAVTGDKIAGKSISGDKLDVNTLSSLSARIGVLKTADSGARTVIKDNLIEVYDENNRLRVRMGVW